MKNVTKIMIALVVFVALGTTSACSKYPGFKKDKQEGFYYKFYVENKREAQPQIGDIIEMTFGFRTKDSVLVKDAFQLDMIVESIYQGDIYAALRKMHEGDSATFIMDGDTFFHYFMGMPFPFDTKELYFDVKLHKIIPQEEFERMEAERAQEYEMMIEGLRLSEEGSINDYLEANNIKVKPTASGLYFVQTVKGKGKPIKSGSRVSLHYTGRFIDGTIFDSSRDYNMPIDITVGQDRFIQGWEEGLLLMRGGDNVTLIIPSNLAYGPRGIQDPRTGEQIIPPYAPLIFDIEVISVE